MTQIIILLTYLWFAIIIKLIYVVYKSGSHDELCNALLTSQGKKSHLYSFYLLSSTDIILLYLVIESYKMFVGSPYLVYNTHIFSNSDIVFQHLIIWPLLYIFSIFLTLLDFCLPQTKTLKWYPQALLQSFCCCCCPVVASFCSHFFQEECLHGMETFWVAA